MGVMNGLTLRDYYHEHGESSHLKAVEAALTAEWQRTQEIATTTGVSKSFARDALNYLGVEGRADKRWVQMTLNTARAEWRLP